MNLRDPLVGDRKPRDRFSLFVEAVFIFRALVNVVSIAAENLACDPRRSQSPVFCLKDRIDCLEYFWSNAV